MAVRFSTIHRRIFCTERSICPALTPKFRHFIKPFDDKTVRILSGVQTLICQKPTAFISISNRFWIEQRTKLRS